MESYQFSLAKVSLDVPDTFDRLCVMCILYISCEFQLSIPLALFTKIILKNYQKTFQIKLSAVRWLLLCPLNVIFFSLSSLLLELFFLDLLFVLARLCLEQSRSESFVENISVLPSDSLNLRNNKSTVDLHLSQILQFGPVDVLVLLLDLDDLLLQEDDLLFFARQLGLVTGGLVLQVNLELAGSVSEALVAGLQVTDPPPQVLHADSQLLRLHSGSAVVTFLIGQGSLQVNQLRQTTRLVLL